MKVEVSRGLRRRRPANFLILLSTILFLSCPQRSLWLLPHTVSLTSFHVSLCSSFSHLFSLLSMCFPKSQTPFLNHLYWHLFSFFSVIQFNRSLSIQFYFFFCLCWFLFFSGGTNQIQTIVDFQGPSLLSALVLLRAFYPLFLFSSRSCKQHSHHLHQPHLCKSCSVALYLLLTEGNGIINQLFLFPSHPVSWPCIILFDFQGELVLYLPSNQSVSWLESCWLAFFPFVFVKIFVDFEQAMSSIENWKLIPMRWKVLHVWDKIQTTNILRPCVMLWISKCKQNWIHIQLWPWAVFASGLV